MKTLLATAAVLALVDGADEVHRMVLNRRAKKGAVAGNTRWAGSNQAPQCSPVSSSACRKRTKAFIL